MIHTILTRCPLFAQIDRTSLASLLQCLSARETDFPKESVILLAGERPESVGILLSGGAHVVHEDFWGNRAILAHVVPGELFGEAFSCAGAEKLPVSVVATEPSTVLLVNVQKILTTCSTACVFHAGLIKNLVRILAEKNVQLTEKMEHLTRRTTRDKLLSYLSALAAEGGGNVVHPPFNRQELADYLAVDRSALSRELSRMQAEGVLRYEKNAFTLL